MKRLLIFVCCQIALCLPAALPAADLIKIYEPADWNHHIGDGPYVSPDGNWIVYWEYVLVDGDEGSDCPATLFSTRADGSGEPVALDTGQRSGGRNFYPEAHISADSKYVIYNPNNGVHRTCRTPIQGGTREDIGPPAYIENYGSKEAIRIAPGEQYIVIISSGRIYSVSDGTEVQLNPYPTVNTLFESDYALSPDGAYVVFRADGFSSRNDGDVALFSVPIGGGEAVRLSGDMPPGQGVGAVESSYTSFTISPDSQSVVYVADQDTNDVFELYSVPITGGEPVKLNPPVTIGDVRSHWISPDSQHVVFTADFITKWKDDIYSAPMSGGAAVKLNEPFAEGVYTIFSRGGVAITRDSKYVAYMSESPPYHEAFASPMEGGAMVRLHPAVPQGVRGVMTFPALSFIYVFSNTAGNYSSLPTGEYSIFCTWVVSNLYMRGASTLWMSPNGRRFIWTSDETWQVELATNEETILFDRDIVPNAEVTNFWVSEQENRIVFLNRDYIYARALEYIESAALPTWEEYR